MALTLVDILYFFILGRFQRYVENGENVNGAYVTCMTFMIHGMSICMDELI
jgi:hypothetical protein